MCGEEGSCPWAPLAVVCHRVPEVLPHYYVRLHHEGTMNQHRSHHHWLIWDLNLRLVNNRWSGDGRRYRSVTKWPSTNVSSALCLCYLVVGYVITLQPKSSHGDILEQKRQRNKFVSLHLFYVLQWTRLLQCCNCDVWWCSGWMWGCLHSWDKLLDALIWHLSQSISEGVMKGESHVCNENWCSAGWVQWVFVRVWFTLLYFTKAQAVPLPKYE